jgi:uncharacterized membrane protein YbaN (DUF454 family)/predicted small lipoprotein YifL
MSARSSLHNLALLAALVACGSKGKAPEADPAKVTAIAKQMVKTFPGPGAKECDGKDVVGGATMTATTFFALAGTTYDKAKPEYQEYVNPHELDSPAARTLLDAKASEQQKRQAAAELLAAPFYLVYHVDLVNAPMALAVKELKRGTVGARAVRFDKTGMPQCVRVFYFQNDKALNEAMIAKSNQAVIDPAVAQALRDDLRVQMLKRVPALTLPQPDGERMGRIPDGMGN